MKSIEYMNRKLYLSLSNYYYGDNLYVSLINEKDDNFCDLTINIPTYLFEDEKEIIINGDTNEKLVDKLEELGIVTDTYKYAFSGYGKYKVMIFNEEKAKDYIKYDNRENN